MALIWNRLRRAVILLILLFPLFVLIQLPYYSEWPANRSDKQLQSPPRYSRLQKIAVFDLERLMPTDNIKNFSSCPRWFTMVSTLKKCLINSVASAVDLWVSIADISTKCGADYIRNLLLTKLVVNKDDIKAIVIPGNTNAEGVFLTLGVGNDTFVEQRIQQFLPNTKFYGVDPILEAGEKFEKIGKYKQIGISESGGTVRSSVLVNGVYQWQNVETITLKNLFDFFGLEEVDFLSIDIEGAEYSLLPAVVTSETYRQFPICQINVELHGPLANYSSTPAKFDRTIKSILSPNSPYIPLWIPKPTMHHRFFLVDWRSPYCVHKYFSMWC